MQPAISTTTGQETLFKDQFLKITLSEKKPTTTNKQTDKQSCLIYTNVYIYVISQKVGGF